MDPMGDEQIAMQYQGSGAIPALAEEEMGEDDEYDDLYNDVNVGENFLQMHRPEVPAPAASAGNGGFQGQNVREFFPFGPVVTASGACRTKEEYEDHGASICRTNPVFKGMY